MSAGAGERAFRAGRLLAKTDPAVDPASGTAVFGMTLSWDGPTPRPGQFFMIKAGRGSALLGRPISVCGIDAGSLRFIIAERGQGTRELRQMAVGESADLTGPLGNGWPLPAAPSAPAARSSLPDNAVPMTQSSAERSDEAQLRPIALIGGGIGVAPLVALAAALPGGSYDFFAGFRSRSFGLAGIAPRDLVLATEDGCEGCRGRIPDYWEPAAYSAVYACGPLPMLRAVAAKAAAAGVACLVSLEARMACGVGACLGCTVRTTAGNRRCCADGPIFDAREVLFDD